ncbi:terminase small subunit [Lonepinella sp. BR2882]|uniref:terminase small subunit n=1 Tax=Lonepinella sp. BR2882 TaxID=3095283 RepID=UPI003F6E23EF
MMTALTPKQETFCLAYIETGNASEAYRQAYNVEQMKPESVHRKAKELLDNGKVAARIEQLQADNVARHNITVDSLLDELEETRKQAMNNNQLSVAVSAVMGKAKLLGFDKPKADNDDMANFPTKITVTFRNLFDKEQQNHQDLHRTLN